MNFKKPSSIVKLLINSEVHGRRSEKNYKYECLRQIIFSRNFTFGKKYTFDCRSFPGCEDGRIFVVKNPPTCFSLWGTQNYPYPLYRIFDGVKAAITCDRKRLKNFEGLDKPSTYKQVFIGLTNSNCLKILECQSEISTKNYYLGSHGLRSSKQEMQWNVFLHQFTITWTFNPGYVIGEWNDIKFMIGVFDVFPLKFKALMIFNQVFSKRQPQKIVVRNGILIVKFEDSQELYDFGETVNKNLMFTANFGEVCEEFNNCVPGIHPHELPVNCVVKELPPVLMTYPKCRVNIGLHPLHYIKTINHHHQLYNLTDGNCPEYAGYGSSDNKFTSPFKNCDLEFHWDNSNRMIEIKSPFVTIHKYDPKSNVIKKQFDLKGGCVFVIDIDYEPELDLLAIFGKTGSESESGKGTIQIFDNCTGKFVKSIYTNIVVDNQRSNYRLKFTLDTILLAKRWDRVTCTCYIFKLADVEEIYSEDVKFHVTGN